MGAPAVVVCPSCMVPFTRHGAARSSAFYRTTEENDTCILCREGLDPVTLAPLSTRGSPMKQMTDSELIDALEMIATSLRLARVEDLRHVGDRAAAIALEARARLLEVLALAEPWPTKDVLARLADAADHLLRDHGCDQHGYEGINAARDAARAIAARITAPHAIAGRNPNAPPLTIKIARLGPPPDRFGNVIDDAAIPDGPVPLCEDFDPYLRPIGRAIAHPDGSAELELLPGVSIDVAGLEADKTIGIGYRVLEEHEENGVRVIDRLELLAVGVDKRLIKRGRDGA